MAQYTVVVEKGRDGYFVGSVVELPGCHTQAKTVDKLMARMKEAVALYLEASTPLKARNMPRFIGIHRLVLDHGRPAPA